MLNIKMLKKFTAVFLTVASVITVFAPTVSAEETIQYMPDLSEYSYITIDEIYPETMVRDLIADTILAETEEVEIYNSEEVKLSSNDYVGNGATIVISTDGNISEVYKTRLYGDLNCDGVINATDLANMRLIMLDDIALFDETVGDIRGDGEFDILDLVRLKKNQSDFTAISQKRISAFSTRFNWLDTFEVPFYINGYSQVFEDFSVVSNDIDLTFSRYYDSNNTASGIFGDGWTATFEGSCTSYGNNSKKIEIYGQTPVVFNLVDGNYVCDYSRASLSAISNGFVFVGEDGLTYTFNSDNYLVSITDKNNNTVSVTVDTNGKIQKVTDSVGREYNYTYGSNGLVSDITDCMERTVNYSYDSSNRLSSVIGVLGTVTERYEYDSNNKLIKVLDAFENRISSISYEENSGIVSSVTDSEAVTTEYVYNSANNSLSLLQDDSVIEQYVYNRYNYLTSSNTEEGLQQNFYCNSYGDVAITENADGSKVQYSYDSKGNPVKITTVTDDEIVSEQNKYDSNNNLLSTVTESETTVYTYDNNGNMLSVTKIEDDNTDVTEYTYTDNGLVQSSETDNITTTYSYNNNGYLIGETDTEGNNRTYIYNTVGWLESEAEAETTANYKYNLNGDTLRETKNSVVTSRTVYDNYGRIKQQIGEAEYNSNYDLLDSSPQTDGYLNNDEEVPVGVHYYYGEDGKLSQIKASCYTVATDSSQKVTSVTAGNTVLARYNYTDDAKELLSSVNYANGQGISYTYDSDGNITALYYGDTLAYSYTYNDEGTLTAKVNLIDNIQTDYTDDSITVSSIAEDGTLTEIYSYGSEMLVELILDQFDICEPYYPVLEGEEPDLERITESFNGQSFCTDYFENSVKYGAVDYTVAKNDENTVNEISIIKGTSNLLNSLYTYTEDNLPSQLVQTFDGLNRTYAHTYDDNGNITCIEETFSEGNNNAKRYYYDDAGQLIRVDDTELNKTVEYVYNGTSGNITAVKTYALTEKNAELGTPISTRTFGYAQSGWTDLLTLVDGNTLAYDDLGNLITYNGYTYTWQAGRRLVGMTNGSNTYSYKYDDNGIRTQKTINGITTHYTTVDGKITGQYDGTNTLYFRYNAENSLIGFNLNGTEYIYFKNIQGDIEGILDLNGNLVVEYTYDAWGKVLSVTGSMADTVGTINPMRYRDYYLDSETGYYYLQSRYYNPEFCRFINADEPSVMLLNLDSEVGANLFSYCNNNPVNYSDPTGHVVTPANIIGAVIGFVIGIVGGYFLSRFLADKLGLKGWKRTFFIVGVSAVITATATAIGYFIGPYIGKAYKALLKGLRGLFKPKFGAQIGRLGTLTRNTKPTIKGLTKHGLQRMAQRGVSKSLAQKIVKNGYAIAQKGGKVLYFTKEGVVVLSASGQVVTAYTSAYFDEAMQAIVSLFYK